MARVTYSEPFLWANDVDNALTAIGHAEVRQPKGLDILFQSRYLGARLRLRNELRDRRKVLSRRCPVVVGIRNCSIIWASSQRCLWE